MHDAGAIIETDVPSRLDRLPWSRFHTLIVVALGITSYRRLAIDLWPDVEIPVISIVTIFPGASPETSP